MPRTKIVMIDGFSLKIGALTLDQVEKYTTSPVADDVAIEDKVAAYKRLNFEMICDSLNNADPDATEKWTEERIRARFDLIAMDYFRNQIFEFSGLKKVEVPLAPQAPEPESTSTISEAL